MIICFVGSRFAFSALYPWHGGGGHYFQASQISSEGAFDGCKPCTGWQLFLKKPPTHGGTGEALANHPRYCRNPLLAWEDEDFLICIFSSTKYDIPFWPS